MTHTPIDHFVTNPEGYSIYVCKVNTFSKKYVYATKLLFVSIS